MPKWGRARLRFTGTDGSLGYRNGKVYDLRIQRIAGAEHPITIRRRTGFGLCPYRSEQAFWANWEPVSAERKPEDES